MPRAIWKGAISFGLLNVPVEVYSGERKADLQFHLLDSRNKARVHYERVNEETGEEVPWDEIVKAYEYQDGQFVLLSDEDFRQADVEASQTVEIQGFVDEAAIASYYYDKPYYLMPGKNGDKGYVLLRETLKRTGKVGVAKVVIRTRQYLAAVIPVDKALILNLMRFDQEVRKPEEFDLPGEDLAEFRVTPKELEMAEALVQAMAGPWEPAQYHDEYRDRLMARIEEKASSGQVAPAAAEPAPAEAPAGKVIDMMDVLKRSVDQAKGGKTSEKSAKAKAKPKTGSRKRAAQG